MDPTQPVQPADDFGGVPVTPAAPASAPQEVADDFGGIAAPTVQTVPSHVTAPPPDVGPSVGAVGENLPRRAIQDRPAPGAPAWAPDEVIPQPEPVERLAIGDQPRQQPPAALEEGAQRPDVQRLGEILRWMDKNSGLEPGQAMEVARIAAASEHPAEYVAAHIDELRPAYPADQTDWKGLAEQHPDLANFILADPVRFALARDPSADLTGIADQIIGRLSFENIAPPGYPRITRPKYVAAPWMAIMRDAFMEQEVVARETAARVLKPSAEADVGDRVLRALAIAHDRGIDGRNPDSDWAPIYEAVGVEKTPEGEFRLRADAAQPEPSEWERKNASRLEELKSETQGRYYGPFAQSTAGRIAFAPFRLTPPLLGGIAATAAGGAAGGPAGAIAGGVGWWTYQSYAPLALQLEQVEGANGKKISSDEASRLALAFSLTGSLLMEGGVAPLTSRIVPEVWAKAMGGGAARALSNPTFLKRVGGALVHLPKDVVAGAAGSAAQEAANATAIEVAKASVDPTYKPDVKEIAARTGEVFIASMGDMLVLGAVGAGRTFLADRGARIAAADSADRVKALTDRAAESKWLASLPPEEAKKAVEAMKRSGGLAPDEVVENFYASLPEFQRYWQEQKVPVDPREAAREIGPETLKAYDAAVAEKGAHLAIPAHEYLGKFAVAENGAHARALAPDITLKPDVNTPRQEAAEHTRRLERTKELAALAPDQMEEGQRKVFDEFQRQAAEAGEDVKVAESNAAWFSGALAVLAESAGRGETAWDLWQIHPINIEGPHQAKNRERAHYTQALEDYDAHPAGKAWGFLRNGQAGAGMEALDARLREQAVAAGEGAVPKDLAAKIEKKQAQLARMEGGDAYAADLAAKVARGEISEAEAAKQRKWYQDNADLATQKSPLRVERLAIDPDAETGLPAVRPLNPGEQAAQTRPLRAPAWLKTEDFLADRQAWEWTWSATGLAAPEHLQKLVFAYMRKAFEGLEPDDIAIQQGWAVARLAAGKGGRKFSTLQEKVRDWMRQPEGQRAEDPIPERAWPHLLTRTRKDTEYVSAGKYVNRKRVEVFEKWMKTTAAEVSEARPTYAERPPAWFAEGEAPASKNAEKALAVRRELDDLNRQAREARAAAAKVRPKLDLDETARILGADAKMVPTEKGGISPDELARAVGAPSGDALLRDMVARRERATWAKQEAARRVVGGAAPRAAAGPPAPAASRALTERWHRMTREERAREFFIDQNTGILNDRGFFALPPDAARPMVGHISVEGTKWLNDGGEGGHAAGDLLYRMVARTLHELVPDAAKIGGDFAVRVKDQAALEALVTALNEKMPVKGFTATGVVGETFQAAHDAHVALKQGLEASGARAVRGERPKGVEVARPEDVVLPQDLAAADLPESLREGHRAMTPRQAFEAAYVEPGTGILTSAGWNGIPRKAHVASIDLDGLKATNERLGTAGGDEVLAYFGELAREYGGLDFDVAHLHGDEYAAQSNDAAALQGFLDTLGLVSDNVRVEVEAADGSVHEVQGIGFSRGVGRTNAEAERALVAHKSERAAAGQRGPDVNARRLRLVDEAGARSPEDLAGRRDAVRARREADARGAPRQAYAGAGGAPEGVAAGRLEQAARLTAGTPEFKAWFRESQVVGPDGAPKLVFHGAKRPDRIGSVFRRSRATSGPMAFFTDGPDIASGYAQNKADTSLEAPSDYAGWFKFKAGRSSVDIDRAWWHLSEEKRRELAEKLPHVIEDDATGEIRLGGADEYGVGGGDHWDYTIRRESRGNVLRAAVEIWLNSAQLFDREEKFLEVLKAAGLEGVELDSPWTEYPSVFPVFLSIQKPFDTSAITPEVMAALEKTGRRQRAPQQKRGADIWDKNDVDPQAWLERVREDAKDGTTHAWTSIPDWVTKTLKDLGYDGIRDRGGKYHDVSHTVWISFEETQVKSVFNRGTWDPASKNILRQDRLVDSLGPQDVHFRIEQKKKGEAGPRGVIEFPNLEPGKAAPFYIRLLDADRSTLAHETFHAFSLIMGQLAGREDAPPELRADYERLVKVMGYGSAEERAAGREVKKEEKGSHLWEMYLFEGKAPSREMLPVLARMRGWFKRLYGETKALSDQYEARYGEKLALSDDAREVFGRLLAGDGAVRDASKEFEVEQPKVAFTPEEQAQSDRLWAEARASAEADLQRQMIEEERKGDREFVREARAKLAEEVGPEIDKEPPYAAIAALSKGDVAGMAVRLDRASVEALVGKDVAGKLPKDVFGEKDGVPPDAVASALHFPSGADLVLALANAEPRDARVKREVSRLMAERYPSLQDRPRAMYEAAKGAMVGDAFLRDGIMRLRAIAREAGVHPTITDEKALKQATDQIVLGKTWSGLRPDRFEAAAKKYARTAAEAKDPQRRLDAYESYLWNRAMYRSALDARAVAEKADAYLVPFTRPKGRAKLGKATEVEAETLPDGTVVNKTIQPYLDKVDEVLAAVEFRPGATRKEVLSRAALEEWVRQRWADGDSVVVPPSVLSVLERQTHWKDLTIQEITDLRDAVKSIAEQADLRTKFMVGGEKIATDRVIEELRAAAIANGAHVKLRFVDEVRTRREKLAEGGRQALHAIEQPEVLIDALDGYDPNGPWHRYYWNPLSDASYAYYDLVRATQQKVQEILRDLPAAERRRISETRFIIEGQEYNLEAAIAVGLNVGNDSNETKITRGMSDPRIAENFGMQPWQGKTTVDAFLAQLTPRDVALINEIHRALESYWPASEALEKRDSGIAPEKLPVRPRRFIGANGEMLQIDGGYYPVIYSRKYRIGKTQAENDASAVNGLPGLFDPGYERALTPKGHLQTRVEAYARPFDLTLDALPRKITMGVKDISFRLTAKQQYRVLMDERIVGALTQALGDKGHDLLVAHLRDSVNDAMLPDPGAGIFRRIIEKLRGLAFQSTFALNVPQALQNLADPAGIAAVMPPRHFMDAALRLAKDPKATAAWIIERSSEMRLRADGMKTLSHDLQSVFRKSELGVLWHRAGELMLVPFETTQQMTEFPTWLGAFNHATEAKEKGGLGLGEEEAVRHADGVLRRMFGGRRTVDLTPVQRDKVLRHFTMFWGWSAAQLNQFIRASGLSRRQWTEGMVVKAMKTLGVTYASLAAKQVASELLVGNGPEPDDEGKVGAAAVGRWLAFRALFTLPGRLPVIGSAISSLEGGPVRDVSVAPWTNALSAGARTLAKSISVASGEAEGTASEDEELALFMSWLEAGAQFTGAPAGQFRRTAHYLMDRPPDAGVGEDVLGTMFGPSRPGKLSNTIYGR